MTPRFLFLALASTVNAYLQASQFAQDTCSALNRWEVARNMTSSAQYLLGSHERSFSLSENCAEHLETAVMNCMEGSKFLCNEFSISVTNTNNTAKGSRSGALAKKSQSDQTSSAESSCTCSTLNAVVSSMSTSEGTNSSVSMETSTVPQSSAAGPSSASATSPSMSAIEGTTSTVSIVSSTPVESSVTTSSSAPAVPSSISTSEAISQSSPSGSLVTPQPLTPTKIRPITATATVTTSGGVSLTTDTICIIKTADLQKGLCYCLDNQIISHTDVDCQIVS